MTTATIKFGNGFEAPWLVAENEDPEQIKEFLIVASGLDDKYREEPLIKVMIHASRLARGLFQNSDKDEAAPATKSVRSGSEVSAPETEKPKSTPKSKPGLAAQAKNSKSEVTEPAEVTDDIPSLIANATSADEVRELYLSNFESETWTEEFTELAKARVAELESN